MLCVFIKIANEFVKERKLYFKLLFSVLSKINHIKLLRLCF